MSYEKVDRCPVCDSETLQNHTIVTDHFLTKESFVIAKCNECGFLFTNPRPDQASISRYYESPDYASHKGSLISLKDWVYRIVRNYNFRWKIKTIRKYIKTTGNILDIGCGTGDFLSFCKSRGWSIEGMEPTEGARLIAENKTGRKIHSSIEDIETEEFKVITLWHVLEHIHNLNHALGSIRNLLSKEGVLLLALPNHRSYDNEYYKDYWAGWDVPRHLYHFDRDSIKKLLGRHGMKIVEILPMKMDSFYVSLLSEKYMGNKNAFLKSFTLGRKSNQLAKKNTEYSSLTYIIKHN